MGKRRCEGDTLGYTETLEYLIESTLPHYDLSTRITKNLADKIRAWALEKVGSNKPEITDNSDVFKDTETYVKCYENRGYNQAKQEIRERIGGE